MLPVVATKSNVRRQMWLHTILMISSSIALISLASLPIWSMAVTMDHQIMQRWREKYFSGQSHI
jgi:heme O synthase-like polyprenyltransferase